MHSGGRKCLRPLTALGNLFTFTVKARRRRAGKRALFCLRTDFPWVLIFSNWYTTAESGALGSYRYLTPPTVITPSFLSIINS